MLFILEHGVLERETSYLLPFSRAAGIARDPTRQWL